MEQKKQVETKVARAEKYAKKISGWCYYVLMVVLSLIGLLLVAIFGIRCWKEFVEGNAWWPYLVVEILGFIGVPSMLLAKKSPCHKWICRRGIRYIVIYTRVSCNMNKGIILRVFGNVKMLLICPNEYIDGTIILALMSDKDTTKKVSVETCERKLHDFGGICGYG